MRRPFIHLNQRSKLKVESDRRKCWRTKWRMMVLGLGNDPVETKGLGQMLGRERGQNEGLRRYNELHPHVQVGREFQRQSRAFQKSQKSLRGQRQTEPWNMCHYSSWMDHMDHLTTTKISPTCFSTAMNSKIVKSEKGPIDLLMMEVRTARRKELERQSPCGVNLEKRIPKGWSEQWLLSNNRKEGWCSATWGKKRPVETQEEPQHL